jgi:hypothetical protein
VPQIILSVDYTDRDAILNAVNRRLSVVDESGQPILPDVDPEMDANLNGRAVAEICRGWMEMLDAQKADRDEDCRGEYE